MKRRDSEAKKGMLMNGKLYSVVLVSVLTVCFVVALSCTRPGTQSAANAQLEHGRYLVEQVGLCADCHTPRDEKGQPVEEKALQGAQILFKPVVPMPEWGEYAPHIAGLAAFTDEQAIEFLTTGKDLSGKFAAPPMPPYRFNKEDATAVVAYLRTLAPKM